MVENIEELEETEEPLDTAVLEEALEVPKEKLQTFRQCVAAKVKEGMNIGKASKECAVEAKGKEKEQEEAPESEPEAEEEPEKPKESEKPKEEPEKSVEENSEKKLEDMSNEKLLKMYNSIKSLLKSRSKFPIDPEKEKMSKEMQTLKENSEKLSKRIEFIENRGTKMTSQGTEELSKTGRKRQCFTNKFGEIWSWDE